MNRNRTHRIVAGKHKQTVYYTTGSHTITFATHTEAPRVRQGQPPIIDRQRDGKSSPSPDGIVLALDGAACWKLEFSPDGNSPTCSSKRANSELAHSPGFWVAISCSFHSVLGPFYMVQSFFTGALRTSLCDREQNFHLLTVLWVGACEQVARGTLTSLLIGWWDSDSDKTRARDFWTTKHVGFDPLSMLTANIQGFSYRFLHVSNIHHLFISRACK